MRIDERRIRQIFRWSLWLKFADSLLEVFGGLALAFIGNQGILRLAEAVTKSELLQDPSDRIANFLLHAAQRFSVDQQTFAAFFLLSHGLVKLVLVVAVLIGFSWAYPAFMAALAVLIAYQTYRLVALGFSTALFLLTVLDVVVLVLAWHEYRLQFRAHEKSR